VAEIVKRHAGFSPLILPVQWMMPPEEEKQHEWVVAQRAYRQSNPQPPPEPWAVQLPTVDARPKSEA